MAPDVTTTTTPDAAGTGAGAEILAELGRMLTELIGEDYLLDVEIGMDTTFGDDLAVESVEFVALAEKLQDRYGEEVDFAAFIAGMELDAIIAMTVGQVVTYVAGCLDG
jgi:acyl carrier protein